MSVNHGIDPVLGSLKYARFEQVTETVFELGAGAQLAKIDVKSTYRIVPVHPDDRPLLEMWWRDRFYVDPSLPFSLRSAPKQFNAIADALEWIARHLGVEFLWHYLDDFITIGRPDSKECHFHIQAQSMSTFRGTSPFSYLLTYMNVTSGSSSFIEYVYQLLCGKTLEV